MCRDAAESRITTLVNTGGDALERYVYTPYGELTIYDATWWNVRSVSSDAHTYTYNGRQLHAETGLYDYRHRTYHSPLGRFASRDLIAYDAGMNLVAYAVNAPGHRIDAFGLQEKPVYGPPLPPGYRPPDPPKYPVDDTLIGPPPCANTEVGLDAICSEANRRRDHGPWEDSAQHCWAACYIGAVYGLGNVAAAVADFVECFNWIPCDSTRDMRAQHHGAALGSVYAWWKLFGCPPVSVADFCDSACNTWP